MTTDEPITKAEDIYSSAAELRRYSNRVELRKMEEQLLDRLFPPPGALVLDLGCGAGRTTAHLQRRGYKVIGADITPAMIEQAKKNVPGVEFRVMDAVRLEFSDNTFDVIWFSFNGIDHIFPASERFAALKQIYRVLKPGGLFVYSSKNLIEMIFHIRQPVRFLRYQVPYLLRQIVRRGFSPYWTDVEFEVYCAPPFSQKHKLKDVGFEHVQLHSEYSRKEWIVTFRDRYPHYSARKPLLGGRVEMKRGDNTF